MHLRESALRSAFGCAVALTIVAAVARGQNSATIAVRLHVTDSVGAPVEGAEITVVRGLKDVLAAGHTDAAGRSTVAVKKESGEGHLVIRKIGYKRADRFYSMTRSDSVAFDVTLSRVVHTLAPVTVTAEEDLRRRAYHIGADEIAESSRAIGSALDVVTKLRPDMQWGLQGHPQNMASTAGRRGRRPASLSRTPDGHAMTAGDCPPIQNVFVNGTRISEPPWNYVSAAVARRQGGGLLAPMSSVVLAILLSIKPEHIDEMQYNDCFEAEAKVNRGTSAVFIVLKPGIGYEQGSGSYALDVGAAPVRPVSATGDYSLLDLPRYRFRVLGVFDDADGQPIVGAAVIDTVSGIRAMTTATGTVALYFLPDGGSTLRVQKPGFRATTFDVAISVKDTVPITLTLIRGN